MTISRRNILRASAFIPACFTASVAYGSNPCQLPTQWDKEVDVIVIGSGGAGLTAAITAKEKEANVAVLEKLRFIGGNTLISGGGFNAAVEADSKAANVEDSPELHAQQTLAAGDFRADPELVKTLTSGAPASVQWLKDHGVSFRPGIYQIYGGLWPRCRNPEGQQGQAYIKALTEQLKKLDIPVYLGHKVVRFIREQPLSGRVLGVEVQTPEGTQYWKAKKGVIAAAGGYAANANLCAKFDPRLVRLNTTNNPGSTGEVMIAMQDIGGIATGLDYIQCIPGAAPGYKKSANLHQVVNHLFFINKNGKRFVAEDSRRDVIRDAMLQQPDQTVFEVADVNGFNENNKYQGARNKAALEGGYMFEAATLEELAKKLGIDPAALQKAVQEFNTIVDTKQDPFGRAPGTLVNKIEKAPFYGCPVGQSRHHTMGGIRINPQAQVLDRNDKVIPGLFAAGEVTGGIHGSNRVGGNAIADIFTFGRIAGESVVQ